MTANTPKLDKSFIEKRHKALIELRATLLSSARRDEADEAAAKSGSADSAHEKEDDAQRLTTLELQGNLVVRDAGRLERVNRALKKIEEGTYGLSDESGKAIARERLEAAPESIYTLSEEQAHERGTSPRRS